MDVNGTPYFLFRGAEAFVHGSDAFVWDDRRGAFTLRQRQQLRLPRLPAAEARAAWAAATPLVRDPFGQVGRIAADGRRIELDAGRGFEDVLDGSLNPVLAPRGRFVDLALGGEGRLVAAYSRDAAQEGGEGAGGVEVEPPPPHGLVLFHLARRWQTVLTPGLPQAPVRAIVDGADRVWCLDTSHLTLCSGEPLFHPYLPQADRFEPEALNPRPFAPLWRAPLPPGWSPLALAADAERLYLLVNGTGMPGAPAEDSQAVLTRALEGDSASPWTVWPLDPEAPFVVDLAPLPGGRLAAPAPREPGDGGFERRDCPVLELFEDPEGRARTARLVRERYPMRGQVSPRLVSSPDGRVRYQDQPQSGAASPYPRELYPLARPEFPTAALVTPRLGGHRDGIDSGRPDTPWHRVYIDGCIPPGCRLSLHAKAYNDPSQRAATPFEVQPAPLWSPLPSELPFHAGLAPSRRGESGLFEVLLQHASGRTRTLTGRYLQLRIRMEGDGRHTPAIHALRVYAPRFSYQEAYLPELFRQRADRAGGTDGPANGADVRERLLAAFEGMLTPIEGCIAASEALLHPDSTPAGLLPVLSATLGIRLPPHWPEARRRRLLAQGGLLQRWRGTLPGVQLALDIATGGAVARGQVVVVENFRLRRTFATILGLDLDDRDHPLTLGTGVSGNSIVGDSLILSDAQVRTFLALLAPELGADTALTEEAVEALPEGRRKADIETVRAFFDRYGHRVSVLLHGPARRDRGLVEEVLAQELPAHLRWRIVETDHPFVLGLAPLLAVDTYLTETPPPRQVALDDTYLGREGLLKNPPALSPRDVNARRSP
jgi:phage tail-like protein